jgi:F0F1-type ATP synthase membrane subunit c/vacuolar-type H+-ATPase subunit K
MTNFAKGNSAARTRYFFWALAIALGSLQAWANRMTLVNDTVSYLDMGDYIWRGQWAMAINGIWGPLYATILGVANGLFRPSLYWEYPMVHLVLFVIFLFTLWSFDFFLRELILLRRESESSEEFSIPDWVWLAIGYTVFLWSSLQLIGVSETNPDMLIAAFFYLVCGLMIRIRRGTAGWLAYLGLGAVLGLGYLTKSIMFPVALICIAVASVYSRKPRQMPQLCGTVLLFLAVAGPFIATLSLARGRVTFGESGRYNYAVHVNRLTQIHWQGESPGNGRPQHGTRQIFDRPATFEFGTPIEATYAAWYDPSYWYEGVRTRFDLRQETRVLAKQLMWEFYLFFDLGGSLIAGLFVMFYMGGRKWRVLEDISKHWFLLVPAVATLGMYALIHFETRYLAPFVVVAGLCLFFSVHLPVSVESHRLCSAVAILIFAMFLSPSDWLLHDLSKEWHAGQLAASKSDPNSDQEVASRMYQLGVRPSDRIASLEYSNYGAATWARLARVRIVAEVYYWPTLPETLANDFWKADSATQREVIQALAETGASVVVSQETPSGADASSWRRVGNSQYYTYRIRSVESGSPSE